MHKNYKEYAMLLKALGDETRIKIVHMISNEELCACKILEEFDITQPTLSYHMRILCKSGLVNVKKDGVWMRYSIDKENILKLQDLFNEMI